MEVRVPVSSKIREKILRAEWDKHIANYNPAATKDPLTHYAQLGYIGNILKDIFLRENRARVKAFENPEMMKFMKKFFEIGKKRAVEMGYRYEDIQLSSDSGFTENGILELRWEPKPGAERIA